MLFAFSLTPAALAQQSSVSGYGGPGGNAQDEVATGDEGGDPPRNTPVTSSDPSALPFTGLDVRYAVGGGILLIAVGAGMARFTPSRERG